MTRVVGSGIANKNPFGATHARAKAQVDSLQRQVEDQLFGKKKPRVIDPDAEVAPLLERLQAVTPKLAQLAGDGPGDYRVVLAQDGIAMIDATGTIYLGRGFLLSQKDQWPLLVGAVAHEVGHRPKRWQTYKDETPRTKAELDALCRQEETYADYFAGRALAELALPFEPLCRFLVDTPHSPHPEYFAPHLRAEVITEGHTDASRRALNKKRLFPELHKHTNAKLDLGTG